MDKIVLTVREVSELLNISLPKTYDLTEIEGFPVIRLNRKKIIPRDQLMKWIDENCDGSSVFESKKHRN